MHNSYSCDLVSQPPQNWACDSRRTQPKQLAEASRSPVAHRLTGAPGSLNNCPLSADMVYPVYHLAYLLGGVSYHCQRLAELYGQIAVRYREITRIPGHGDSNDAAMFGRQTKPYYGF